MIRLLICTLFLGNHCLFSQVFFDKTTHVFGELNASSDRYVDFTLLNKTNKTAFILRIANDREISYRFSSKTIKPDSSIVLRLQYNPSQKGKFKKEIPIYLSASPEPTMVTLTGTMLSLPQNLSPDCPDFSSSREDLNLQAIGATVKVIDKKSKRPIPETQIKLFQDPKYTVEGITDASGNYSAAIPLGLYFVIVNSATHQSEQRSIYFNKNNRAATFELQALPKPTEQKKEEAEQIIAEKPITDPTATISPKKDTIEPVSIVINEGELSVEKYKVNNLIFLLDISSSMQKRERIELLKQSVLALLPLLRTIDYIGIITYATNAKVLLENQQVTNKQVIKQLISEIKAEGFTKEGKGIKKAYEMANQHYNFNGNNEIIIITDGIFNIYKDQEIIPLIRKNARKGIKLSVIGMKNGELTSDTLQDIARKGKGTYIKVNNEDEAKTILVNQIKKNSAITH